MYICKQISRVVIFLKLLLLCITSICAASLTNNTSSGLLKNSTFVTKNVSDMPMEGGGKLTQSSNGTTIAGPNLGSASTEIKSLSPVVVETLSAEKKLFSSRPITEVLSEGGGKSITLPSTSKSIHIEPAVNINIKHNVSNNVTSNHPTIMPSFSKVSVTSKSALNIPMEGGDMPKLMKDVTSVNSNSGLKSQESLTSKKPDEAPPSGTPQHITPVLEGKSEDQSNRRKIAPRKGVNNSEYTEFKKLESNFTKPIVKKPLFTEATDEESLAATLELNSKANSTIPVEVKPKVPTLDNLKDFSNNTQQYVIPIVIVILSVPLVTIVISFLLKRGAEWWKYRHYRRMDFLINGIYDN